MRYARLTNILSELLPRLRDHIHQRGFAGAGYGIHWPEIDEDSSTEGLLRGALAAAELSRRQQ